MDTRKINFICNGQRGDYEIPYSFSLIINLYPEIKKQFKLEPNVSITLYVTLINRTQYVFKPEDTIDSFIEKSKGGRVTIYVKQPVPQVIEMMTEQVAQLNVANGAALSVLKPGEERFMENTGPLENTVIDGKKAVITGGLTIDLGCGASVHIPEGHELLRSGKKIGFQQIQTSTNTFGCSPVVNIQLLDN